MTRLTWTRVAFCDVPYHDHVSDNRGICLMTDCRRYICGARLPVYESASLRVYESTLPPLPRRSHDPPPPTHRRRRPHAPILPPLSSPFPWPQRSSYYLHGAESRDWGLGQREASPDEVNPIDGLTYRFTPQPVITIRNIAYKRYTSHAPSCPLRVAAARTGRRDRVVKIRSVNGDLLFSRSIPHQRVPEWPGTR